MSALNILKKLNRRDTQLFPKLPKINKKIKYLSISIVFTIFTILLSRKILAVYQLAPPTIEQYQQKQKAMGDGNNQESWMNEAATSNVMVATNAIGGTLSNDVLTGKAKATWVPGGLIGFTNKSIAALYMPPFSGIEYLASIKDNFLGKPAYAQGIGFKGLQPIQSIWKGFRNTTYVIFSLVFIIMGVMIMLRVKISQQAVATIQNTIPKIITSLILVTFSYAIVGLLIDLSYVIEAILLYTIFHATGDNPFNDPNLTIGKIMTSGDISSLIWAVVPNWLILKYVGIISLIITGVSAAVSGGSLAWLGLLAFGLIYLVIFLTIFINVVKLFFGLAKCYIVIILKTIIAPLEIAFGAIPNMKIGFNTWFTDIIANLLVFPISVAFITLVNGLVNATYNVDNNGMWLPPGVDTLNWWAGGVGGGILPVAFAFAGLVLIAKLPTMIPEFVFQIKPSPWGKAIGEGASAFVKNPIVNLGKNVVTERITNKLNPKKYLIQPNPNKPKNDTGGKER